ncbi:MULTISPECIES: PTS sugar transporter subunit IIB [Enterobacter]|uniref:PTS sugar transporter subunit IIB n=1 Tax=Enterobacter TaxID=547 RepID=UPI001F506890|nr:MULTISPECIES: hypothetical protein [Enterobacter]
MQILLLALGVVIYLPFLTAYERSLIKRSNETIINTLASESEITPQEDNDIHRLDGKTIILACNEGMSTSLMASKMRKYCESQNCTLNVYAVNAGKLVDEYKNAQLILLGPQIAYLQETILQDINHHCPVIPLDPQHFSKLDGPAVIHAALPYFKKESV